MYWVFPSGANGQQDPPKGKNYCYCLWKLQQARDAGFLILVEGETDTLTLWYHGFPALGIPGANTAKTALVPEILKGISLVYVWREPTKQPGLGGDAFVASIARLLRKFNWAGNARLIQSPKAKDPNELHVQNPEEFRDAFQAILDKSIPLPEAGSFPKARKYPAPSDEVEAAAQAAAAEQQPPPGGYFAFTDWGNAKRLVHRYGTDLLYCTLWRKWLIWDGMRYKADDNAEIMRRVKKTILAIYGEVKNVPDDNAVLRTQINRHAAESESWASMTRMVKCAESEISVAVLPEQLDRDEWLFNVENGTVNLVTGEFREHQKEDRFTKVATVRFEEGAKAPLWDEFLETVMNYRTGLVKFLQKAVGYSMTAQVGEKCMFFLHGGGDNGKSTFIETLASLFGDYWCKTPAETVLSRHGKGGDGVPNDVARLMNVRMVSAAEVDEKQQLSESRVKDLTGGDTISARFMRAEWFDFRPVFKLWMYGNHRPIIQGTDDAIWNRIRLVPFDVTIAKEIQRPNFREELKVQLPGILNWSIQGCLDWKKEGLGIPDEVGKATKEYRSDMNVLGRFIDEECARDKKFRIKSSDFYSVYSSWCNSNGEFPLTQTGFSIKLKHIGLEKKKSEDGWYWLGIRMADFPDESAGSAGNPPANIGRATEKNVKQSADPADPSGSRTDLSGSVFD
jgi:putative DNA primase/helicase